MLIVLCALAGVSSGCVYHFTNQHVTRPEGIQSVAVEAVYDTSREVLPHEMLWESLQQAFAADGHLRLLPQSQADALVRAHIQQASVAAGGTDLINGPYKDPDVEDVPVPPTPGEFRRLSQAGEYRDKGILNAVVTVEVWSLRTRTLLLKQTYPMSTAFQAVHADPAITTRANDHLRYEESLDAKFKLIAQQVSAQVVRDLLVR